MIIKRASECKVIPDPNGTIVIGFVISVFPKVVSVMNGCLVAAHWIKPKLIRSIRNHAHYTFNGDGFNACFFVFTCG